MKMVEDLVYDVGLHNGADTAHYLECGFRVVAIDANPAMVELARQNFAEHLSSNRLVLLNAAIGDKQEERIFWVSDKSDWSSFNESVAKRNGTHAEGIKVRCEPFSKILERFGIPYYLKIDIEGGEDFCIEALAKMESRPSYISWEATYPRGIDQLRAIRDLGYTRFKIIRQTDFLPVLGPPYSSPDKLSYLYWRVIRKAGKIAGRWQDRPGGSSGPLSEASLGRWFPWHEIARRWRDYCESWLTGDADTLGVWFDFHDSR
jgi:FkbM family methyltransferase